MFIRNLYYFTRVLCLRSLTIAMLVCLAAGCFKSNDNKPLTTEHIKLLSNARLLDASIERIDPHEHLSFGKKISSALLESLIPIKIYEIKINKNDFEAEYRFTFQSGADPVIFEIRICGDKLCYKVRNFVYQGGDSKEFMRLVDKLIPVE